MEPAKSIIDAFGGPTELAKVVGIHRTRVSKWKSPRDKGGTGGVIPHWHVETILSSARDRGLNVSLGDFAPQISGAA